MGKIRLHKRTLQKSIISLVLALMTISISHAQENDKANMECLYRLSFLKDTTSTVTTDDLMVLRFNKDKSLFYSYNSYIHIPEHTRSLSGSLLGYKTIP